MVLLTMTSALVAALQRHPELQSDPDLHKSPKDPSLQQPQQGNPISHGQILDIYNRVKQDSAMSEEGRFRLHDLLRGADVYVPPPEPKQEPTSEYKELMARLRRDEESRAYNSMINSSTDYKNPFQKFAAPNNAAAWDLGSSANQVDEMKMSDVNRQVALIINVIVSIIACGIAVWLLLRQWSAPARLALSMSCGGIVGIAEVGIYAAYVRKVDEAKSLEKAKPEERSVTDTWIIEGTKQPIAPNVESTLLGSSGADTTNKDQLRHRKPNSSSSPT